MIDQVVLHIGTNETRSSSIQHTLAGFNDGETLYTNLGANQSAPVRTIFAMDRAGALDWRKRGIYGDVLDRLRDDYGRALDSEVDRHDRRQMIMSADNIWRFDAPDKWALLGCFGERGIAVRVVCYVRENLSLAVSSYQRNVKGSGEPFEPFDAKFRIHLKDLRPALPEGSRAVRTIAPGSLVNGCVFEDFCKISGIRPAEIKRATQGLKRSAVNLLRLFNKVEYKEGSVTFFDDRFKLSRSKLVRQVVSRFSDPKINLA